VREKLRCCRVRRGSLRTAEITSLPGVDEAELEVGVQIRDGADPFAGRRAGRRYGFLVDELHEVPCGIATDVAADVSC